MPTNVSGVSHMKLAVATLALGAASLAATIVGLAGENDNLFGKGGYNEYYPSGYNEYYPSSKETIPTEIVSLQSVSESGASDSPEEQIKQTHFLLSSSGNSEPVEVLAFTLSADTSNDIALKSLAVRFIKQKSSSKSKVQTNPACGLVDFSLSSDLGHKWKAKMKPASAPGSAPLQFTTEKNFYPVALMAGKTLDFHLFATAPKMTSAAATKIHGCEFVAQLDVKDIELLSDDGASMAGETVKGDVITALAAAPVITWSDETPSGAVTGENDQVVARLIVNNMTESGASINLSGLPIKLQTSDPAKKVQTVRIYAGELGKSKALATAQLKPGKSWASKPDGIFEIKFGDKFNKPVTLAPGEGKDFVVTLDTAEQSGELCFYVRSKDITWRFPGKGNILLKGVGASSLELTEPSCINFDESESFENDLDQP